MKNIYAFNSSLILFFGLTFYPLKLICQSIYPFNFSCLSDKICDYCVDLDLSSNKFCFTDQLSNIKTELVLVDGGDAEITFYNVNGVVTRRGQANWRGTSDGPGGDMAKIYLRLSTGVTLTFRAVVDQYSSKITMLIDSRDNTWILCY
jgi:hypothetical protein